LRRGHELAVLTGTSLRSRVERSGAKVYPLPEEADLSAQDVLTSDEMKAVPLGPQWLRIVIERIFVDTIPAQYSGVHKVLREFPADIWLACDRHSGRS
jgi:hypothetical protein